MRVDMLYTEHAYKNSTMCKISVGAKITRIMSV